MHDCHEGISLELKSKTNCNDKLYQLKVVTTINLVTTTHSNEQKNRQTWTIDI